jgi:hypothetical protein
VFVHLNPLRSKLRLSHWLLGSSPILAHCRDGLGLLINSRAEDLVTSARRFEVGNRPQAVSRAPQGKYQLEHQ